MKHTIKRFTDYLAGNLDLVGIVDGQWAFVGPELVQIDLTNSCNNDCIGCWCRSPLLKEKALSDSVARQTLSTRRVKRVLDDCAAMGTTNIYLAGGGEPFMHPDIMEIIAHIKNRGMACHVNTNFTLVDTQRAEDLVAMGVDHLIVSLWAATAQTYSRTHPNKSGATFDAMVRTLKHILSVRNGPVPEVILYHVIMRPNYHEIEAMVQMAVDLGVNAVEFAVVDVIPGYTDRLLVDTAEQTEIVAACRRVLGRLDPRGRIGALEVRIGDFFRKASNPGAHCGDYESEMLSTIPCVIGWNFSRILADGNVNACLKAHRIPVGNIYRSSFAEIWNSSTQRNFRRKTLEGNTEDPFFSRIGNDETAQCGCLRGCDDVERNRRLWLRLQRASWLHKLAFKGIGLHLRRKRNLG